MATKDEIKKAMDAGNVVMGIKEVEKGIKTSTLIKVICADNMPHIKMESMKFYSRVSNVEVAMFEGDSVELGRLCGKPFSVTVLGIKK
jgi:large subunit ribosomal protein L30e